MSWGWLNITTCTSPYPNDNKFHCSSLCLLKPLGVARGGAGERREGGGIKGHNKDNKQFILHHWTAFCHVLQWVWASKAYEAYAQYFRYHTHTHTRTHTHTHWEMSEIGFQCWVTLKCCTQSMQRNTSRQAGIPALPCSALAWPGQGIGPRVAFAYILKIVFCAHSYLVRHVLAVAGAVRVQWTVNLRTIISTSWASQRQMNKGFCSWFNFKAKLLLKLARKTLGHSKRISDEAELWNSNVKRRKLEVVFFLIFLETTSRQFQIVF